MTPDLYKNDYIRGKNLIWKVICKRLGFRGKLRVSIAFISFIAILFLLSKISSLFFSQTIDGSVIGVKSQIKPTIEIARPTPRLVVDSDNSCYTDWVAFTNDYWEGLHSKFWEVNGVYTIPDKKTTFDSVAYYVRSCKGGIKAELKFISFAERLINLNLYHGTQFRWEIGGNDLRSVKLYKNRNCTANWYGKEVDTENKYLPMGEKILPGQLTNVSLLVFLTADGKLRTELHIRFTSPKSGEKEVDDLFYYEFNVGPVCDSETVPNINLDYDRIGVGLMRSSYEIAEPPRVRFNEFRVGIYPEKGQE